ncbi:hypothetical protein [Helicobacter sp. MIT 99-10781]|nr:hypothetical protein [Helicobacter sp. MIT 99-10781]
MTKNIHRVSLRGFYRIRSNSQSLRICNFYFSESLLSLLKLL